MSFILDALRKSENERQRDAAPNLARAPLAAVRHRVPVWTWLLIGLLSIALLGLGAAFWRGGGGGQTPAITEAVAPPSAVPAATVATATEPPRPEAQAATQELRPIRELALVDPDLPAYRLELLAFNGSDPANSSAWINGQRYVVGDSIGRGPEVVEIRADGVVLAWAGRRFLLSTR
jgi:general secretion pathway protein B